MDRITDILVIANPLVRDQPAIAKAATLARWLGASIELLICDTQSSREAHTEGGLPALTNALLSDNVLDAQLARGSGNQGYASPLARHTHIRDQHRLALDTSLSGAAVADQTETLADATGADGGRGPRPCE
jgi:hypothetical protein